MEALQIALADGRTTQTSKLREYFEAIFRAEDSGELYPVDLGHIWPVGYGRKDNAVAALRAKFEEGTDYQVSLKIQEKSEAGRPEEVYNLTTSCAEWLAVRANRAVFEVYRACRQAVKAAIQLIPRDLPSALRLAADLAEQKAALTHELALAQPAIEFTKQVGVSANTLSMSEAAKWLKIKGFGRTKLCAWLRTQGIFSKKNEPKQQYINEGYFEVKAQTFAAGTVEQRVGCTPRITGEGIVWIQKRLKKQAENI